MKNVVGTRHPVLVHLVVRAAGFVVVALGMAATVVGLALPWTIAGARHPDLVTIAGIAFLAPLLSALCVAYLRTEPHRSRLIATVAAVAGGGAAVIAAALARLVEPSAGIGLGGPLTVAGAAATAAGWVALAITGAGPLPARAWRPWLAVGAAAAVLVVAAGFAVDWAREGRFVEATTAGKAPAVMAQPWPLPFTGVQLVGVHGDLAVLRAADGIRAVWLSSGTTAWQYLRSDLSSQAAGLVDDAVVVAFGTEDGVLVTALEAATGAERFSQRYRSAKMATVHAAGRTAVLAGAGTAAGDVLGIDARSGTQRWRWTPARNGGACDITDLAATAESVAVAVRCRAQGVDDVAVGLAATTGAERWSWHAIQRGTAELKLVAAGTGFVALTGAAPQRAVYMDGSTGTVGAHHDAAGTLPVAAGTTLLYAEPSATRAHLTAVDVRTGAVQWDTGLPGVGGYQPLAGTAADGRAYFLWRGSTGAMRLLTTATADGATTEERAVACTTRCPEVSIAAAGPHAVVATREEKATQLYLSAT
jgi:outer membrane protein assembly factor BamB